MRSPGEHGSVRPLAPRGWSRGVRVASLAAVALALAAGIGLRFLALDRFGFWLDEAYSVRVASEPVEAIVSGEAGDAHTPPLYYLLLHAWLRLGGSDAWVRGLSAAFSVLLLLGLPVVLRKLGVGLAVAAVTTVALAFSPHHVYFAQEARMYSLAALLTVAIFALEEASSRRRRLPVEIGLALVAALGLYCHYYFAFVIAGSVLFRAVRLLRGRPGADGWSRLLATHSVTALLFLPWLPVVLRLAGGEGQYFRAALWHVPAYSYVRMLLGYAVMPTTIAMKADPLGAALAAWPWLATAGGLGLLAVLGFVLKGDEEPRGADGDATARSLYAHAATVVAVTIAAPLPLSLLVPMYGERYIGIVQPLVLLLIAAGLLRWQRPFRTAALASLLAMSLGASLLWSVGVAGGKEGWREVAAHIEAHARPGDVLAIDPPYCDQALRRYLKRRDLVMPFPETWRRRRVVLEPCREPESWRYGSLWVVVRADVRYLDEFDEALGPCLRPATPLILPDGVGVLLARYQAPAAVHRDP